MKYAKEPWTMGSSGLILDANNTPLPSYYDQSEINERIVACINFCRELDTAFLEAHILKNPVPPDEWAGCREEQFACWAAVVRDPHPNMPIDFGGISEPNPQSSIAENFMRNAFR